MTTNSAEGIRWDLSDLFSSYDDPRIDTTLNDCRTRAETLSRRFRDTINVPEGPAPEHLLQGLKELEEIEEALSLVANYSSLLYAADSLKVEYQDLEQRVEQRVTEVRNLLLFFELEWMKLRDEVAEQLVKHPTLKVYSHYLKNLRRFCPHKLSEAEEKIVNEKDNTGRNAFGRLFSEITSSLTFSLEREGKLEELTLSEILALLHQTDREVRRGAWETLFEGLSHHEQVQTFVYDTLIQDHLTMDRLRHYPDAFRNDEEIF